jgi:hypothetical protein
LIDVLGQTDARYIISIISSREELSEEVGKSVDRRTSEGPDGLGRVSGTACLWGIYDEGLVI